MSIYKFTITDESVRDVDTDNILDEKRVEKKFIFGICVWKKESTDKSEYIKVEKRRVGYGN
jgi:hypothetical protein